MNKENLPKKVLSGDQAVFSQWDSLIKLHGFRRYDTTTPIHHQFHLADALGRSNEDNPTLTVTSEKYGFRNNKEVQPSWFAVSEIMPPLTLLSLLPHRIGSFIGEKFDGFAKSLEKTMATLSEEEKGEIQKAIAQMGVPYKLAVTINGVYEQLTQGNWHGIVDSGKKSASFYNFTDIEPAQRKLLLTLYGITAALTHPSDRKELKKRFREVAGEEGEIYNVARDKMLPEVATKMFKMLASRIEQGTGRNLGEISLGDTTDYFELPRDNQPTKSDSDSFRFLNWYLKNRKVYDESHNEIAEELSKRGENPIQPLASNKGETPFWVIINGVKHKLNITDNEVKVTQREGNQTKEDTISITNLPTTHTELANILYRYYGNKKISVMPTAIGLALNLRASGDLLLPEQGSHYMEQVNLVWQRIVEKATPEQIEPILQNDVIRVHPHAMDAIPDGKRIRLPWYLSEGFKIDEEGFVNTTDLKAGWKNVINQRKDKLAAVLRAKSIVEKARILFGDSNAAYVKQLITRIETTEETESQLKLGISSILDQIRTRLDKKEMRLLGQISAFAKGEVSALPEAINMPPEIVDRLNVLRSKCLGSKQEISTKFMRETILKYLTSLKIRQLLGGIEAIEYFDARPSLLTMYFMFGEESVKNVMGTTQAYRETTPKTMEKKAYSTEGNRILVVNDRSNRIGDKKSNLAQAIAKNLVADNLDTGIILTPLGNPEEADFALTIVGKDGSVGGMCGDGVIAAARYVFENYGKEEVRLKTDSGKVVVGFKDGEAYGARLSEVKDFQSDDSDSFRGVVDIPAGKKESLVKDITQSLSLDPAGISIIAIRSILGEPHMITVVKAPIGLSKLKGIAKQIVALKNADGKPLFPQGINVNFLNQETNQLLTYERAGVDNFTGACGTGSICAASIIFESRGTTATQFRTKEGTINVSRQGKHYVIKGNVVDI